MNKAGYFIGRHFPWLRLYTYTYGVLLLPDSLCYIEVSLGMCEKQTLSTPLHADVPSTWRNTIQWSRDIP
jgi:hypothetical protein